MDENNENFTSFDHSEPTTLHSELEQEDSNVKHLDDTSECNSEPESTKPTEETLSEIPDEQSKKKIYKKKNNSDYFLFGYVPNYKVPVIGIPISYPFDVIANIIRFYIFSKIGFSENGIEKKSVASKLQAFIYGGQIPKKSFFAYLQSFSTRK